LPCRRSWVRIPSAALFNGLGWVRRVAGRFCLIVIVPLSIVAVTGCAFGSGEGHRDSPVAKRIRHVQHVVVKQAGDLRLFSQTTSERAAERLPTHSQIQRAEAQADTPTSIAFWNQRRGLIGGGRDIDGYCAGTISLTADGGRTVHVAQRVRGIVDWVTTAGVRTAWAHVGSCGKNQSPEELLRSADGGRTWEVVSRLHIEQPSFANQRQGIAFGRDQFSGGAQRNASTVQPLETSDGGHSWHLGDTRICQGRSEGFDFVGSAVSFPDPDHAWVVCSSVLGTQIEFKRVYETSDGGDTWEKVSDNKDETATEDPLPQIGYTFGTSFTSSGFGILDMGDNGLGVTHDGGRHWAPAAGQLPKRLDGKRRLKLHDFGPATVAPPTTIFALVYSFFRHPVLLIHSDDGGATWAPVHEWASGRHPLRAAPGPGKR
jgi:photosystem II stability/assembly factor-like uncharacterized protein